MNILEHRGTLAWLLVALLGLVWFACGGAASLRSAPYGAAGVATAGGTIPSFHPGSDELWVIEDRRNESPEGRRGGPGSGSMVTRDAAGTILPVPLKHTDVRARIRGYLSTVDVQQSFHNPYAGKIEAVYVFPLPEDAAVRDFVMQIGERRIRGIIRPSEEAKEIYLEARSQGYRAALLEQARPNVFEQAVANLEPGDEIDVHIRYFHTLAYASDGYEFVFPMVVGPRYNPAHWQDGIGSVPADGSTSGQPVDVPYLCPPTRSGHDLALTVDVDAVARIRRLDSPSHEVRIHRTSQSRATVTLAGGSVIPNRDFVLRYEVAGEESAADLLAHADEHGGHFTMMVHPPADLEDLPRQPMELVFVLDTSGSMSGVPMRQAKAAAKMALDNLGSKDSFQIIRFSESASSFASGLVSATPENIALGRAYLRSLSGGGGTEMLAGIEAALELPHDGEKLRFVVFLTDGYIGNEVEIFDAVRTRIGSTRVFSLGVGSSVNRHLMEGLARLGRGAVGYLLHDEDPGRVIAQLWDRITHPAMTDLRIDWGEMEVADVFPTRLPDLFVGRPIVLNGRLLGGTPRNVRVLGRVGGRAVALDVRCREATADEGLAALPALWARRKIQAVSDFASLEGRAAAADEVRALALAYGLMSDYTSYVAVDSTHRTAGDHGVSVRVPVPVPDGVRYDTSVQGK